MNRFLLRLALCVIALSSASIAHAANWPNLPVACTPDRAKPWDPNKSPNLQPVCHCPPGNLCPVSPEEYNTPSLQKMPPEFIFGLNGYPKCCPSAPTCPDGSRMPSNGVCGSTVVCPSGTNMAGQPLPADRECNRCQEGTVLAGQVAAYGQCTPPVCNVSLGECEPPPTSGCPYYPEGYGPESCTTEGNGWRCYDILAGGYVHIECQVPHENQCFPATVEGGTVGPAPQCAVTCNPGLDIAAYEYNGKTIYFCISVCKDASTSWSGCGA